MTSIRRPAKETARLGDAIYERDIRPRIEAAHHGEYVAIDVDSGSWAVADSILAAAERLRERSPEANDVWSVRVGYRALHHFGGRPLDESEVIAGAVNAAREAVVLDDEVKRAFVALADDYAEVSARLFHDDPDLSVDPLEARP